MPDTNGKQRKAVVSESNRELNRLWVRKQEQMHKDYSGYYWGMTISGFVLLSLLVYALMH